MRQMNDEKIKESIEDILDLIRLKNDRNTLSKDLSGGMKRRLSIGISLINNPKVNSFIYLSIEKKKEYIFIDYYS